MTMSVLSGHPEVHVFSFGLPQSERVSFEVNLILTYHRKGNQNVQCSALFRAGLLKVNRIFRSAPSSHFRCMSNEAFQLYFFGKLSLTFAYLSENPESLIIWKFEKKN